MSEMSEKVEIDVAGLEGPEKKEPKKEAKKEKKDSKKAIDAPRLNAFALLPEEVVIIGLDTNDGPEHPLYDDRIRLPVDESFIKGIMRVGVRTPILVRKNGDHVEVVAGRQRVKAAREANRRLVEAGQEPIRVPAMTQRVEDADALALLIVENEQREQDNIISRARKAQRLLDMGRSLENVAEHFRRGPKTIEDWVALLDLDGKVIKAIERGDFSAAAAKKLLELPREEQVSVMETLIASGQGAPTAEEAEEAVDRKKGKAPKKEEGAERPGARVLSKLLDAQNKGALELDTTVVNVIRWMMGDLAPQRIAGLSQALRLVNEHKLIEAEDGTWEWKRIKAKKA